MLTLCNVYKMCSTLSEPAHLVSKTLNNILTELHHVIKSTFSLKS